MERASLMDRVNSVEEFLGLYESEERTGLPLRVEAPARVWEEIIRNHPSFRRDVAMNKTIPVRLIRLLAADEDDGVRAAIANKRKTPTDVLEMLAEDENESVR